MDYDKQAERLYYAAFAGTRSAIPQWHTLTKDQKQPFLEEAKKN